MHPLPLVRCALILGRVLAVASALLLAAAAPPEPLITAAPAAMTTSSSASFDFRVIGRDAYTYECKVGARLERFEPCSSPYAVTGLPVGTHTFQVRAIEGNAAGLPATHTWTITAIDDDGDGHALPADCDDSSAQRHPGAPEVPNNGIDEDCSGADHVIVIPPITLPTIPVPTVTPNPTPAAPKPKLAVSLSYFMNARKRETRFSTLSVKGVTEGRHGQGHLHRRLPAQDQTLHASSGTVALTGFATRRSRQERS